MRLKGMVALVTGSGRGIGKSIATLFAQEGATVLVNDVDADKVKQVLEELKEKGYQAYGCPFDVTDRAAINDALNKVVDLSGHVDILVNNAGISPKKNGQKIPLKDMSYEEWTWVVDVNLNGVFNCCQAVIPGMIKNKRGKIINISSASARVYTAFTGAHYITTKAAVIGLTHALAGELAEYGINVNAIAPGRVWTEMAAKVPQKVNDDFLQAIPLKKFASTEDIAKSALFLASEESSYITGTTLDVNGGFFMN
jgi:3-oxoacyl-[acyl-carrier protein] reductase